MIVTESEATAKWCPHSRVFTLQEGREDTMTSAGTNRFENGALPKGSRCLGSQCMSWRWEHTPIYGLAPSDPPRGFCGLAYSVRLP